MHIYNITFTLEKELEQEIISWLREEFIPRSVTADGEYFGSAELLRVGHTLEPGTASLALHLRTDDAANIDDWYADRGCVLFDAMLKRWPERVVYFPTLLEVIE